MIWIDITAKTKLIKGAENTKIELMQNATGIIVALTGCYRFEYSNRWRISKKLMEWKLYRVLLSRMDISIAPNIEWAKLPIKLNHY
ncbi:MAG: tail fiber assembly protein [Candidatus Phlomobacter fragariae]